MLKLTFLWLLSFSILAQAQIVVPNFGSRGEVPASVIEDFMAAFRNQLEEVTSLEVLPGDLVTAGIASSLEPEFTYIIAELGKGRYALSGEITGDSQAAPGSPGQQFTVTILVVDAETRESSDLISQALEGRYVEAARALSLAVQRFLNRANSLAEGSAGLFISSQPGQAQVFVNGVNVGETSELAPLMLQPGRYEIEFRKEGFLPQIEAVILEAERTEFINVLLTPISGGSIQVNSQPAATVFVDDREVGLTPITVQTRPGLRQLRLERPGFAAKTLSVNVRNFRVSRVSAKLEPNSETRLFWEPPENYLLFIDGVLRLDSFAADLTPGPHKVELRQGGEALSFNFDLPEEGVFVLDLDSLSLLPFEP